MWLIVYEGSLKYPAYVLFLLLLIRITYFLFTYSMKEAGLGHKQWRGGPISSNCKQCPVVYTNPVCGSDGHTYSSQVRIKYRTELYFQCSLQFQLLECKILYSKTNLRLFALNIFLTSFSNTSTSEDKKSKWWQIPSSTEQQCPRKHSAAVLGSVAELH